MKKLLFTVLLLCSTNCICILYGQSLDVNGDYIRPGHPEVELLINATYFSNDNNTILWDSIRGLDEINIPDTADAYPYISFDGLRIYFTHGNGGSLNLYYASRTDINSYFNNPQLLSSSFPPNSVSCWLTNDELEIYFINSYKLYFSTRASISSSFSEPVAINLIHPLQNNYLGPSLTPDKQELYLYSNHIGNQILRFIKTDTLTYTIVDTLAVPSNLKVSPGQLSKTGLKYYLSLKDNYDSLKLYVMERPAMNEQFDNLSMLTGNINSGLMNIQPSVSYDENILVFVRNNENTWYDNDLFVAVSTGVGISSNPDQIIDFITISPNLCGDKLNVNVELQKDTFLSLQINDISGRTLSICNNYCQKGKCQITLDTETMTKGLYFLNTIVGDGSKTIKFIKN